MRNMYRMDMHRLKHSRIFYVAIAFVSIMAFALVFSGMAGTMGALLGASGPSVSGDDFMNSAMGAGVIFILLGIALSAFVCGDYSGGFANNIFTAHANPWDYIGGKMLAMATASAFLLLLYTAESMLVLLAFGHGLALGGGALGLVFFLIQKWLVSIALCAVVLLVNVFTRKLAWGITAAFLIATGGLSMGISLFANAFGLTWLNNIFSITISGSSQICTLSFSFFTFIRVLAASGAWAALGCIASKKVLLFKDI